MKPRYPDSKVELTPFLAKYYDQLLSIGSIGFYQRFIKNAIDSMNIREDDRILDLGCGTGKNARLMYKYNGNSGDITGIDISEDMERQFKARFAGKKNVQYVKQPIDEEFELEEKFDKIFISFVIHGFPHEIRKIIINNVLKNLKEGGEFIILDFAEFDMFAMPPLYRLIFQKVECKYAFDYIEKDWKSILSEFGFKSFEEKFFFKNYVRLLTAKM